MFFRTTPKTIVFLALPSLFLYTQQSLAVPPQAEPTKAHVQSIEQSDAFIRVSTPLTKGEFSVNIERLADGEAIRLTLIGKMWDPSFKGVGVPDDAWDAKLTFVFPEHWVDEIQSFGPLRSWKNGDTTELYSAEPLTPDAALWFKRNEPELGSIEIWNTPTTGLDDFAVISLFHTLVLSELDEGNAPAGTPCVPSFGDCYNNAKNACLPNGMGSFEYSCDQGAVVCKFTCLEPVPE